MSSMNYIYERANRKKTDYEKYDFARNENDALKTFFDLAQEVDSIQEFYDLCVVIPKIYFDRDARLYSVDPATNNMSLVSRTEEHALQLHTPPPQDLKPSDKPFYTERNSIALTIRGKGPLIEELPFEVHDNVLGLLEIYPADNLGQHAEFFFQKYANRIGFNIHNRFLVRKNIEHLRFIRSLVADIEHNIIVPNMVYKLFLRGLKRRIEKNTELEKDFITKASAGSCDAACMQEFIKELADINLGLNTELENIEKHYKNMSLFIETLFRKSHFDQGRLTLRTKTCNMKNDVVLPQLDRYIERLSNAGISTDDRLSGIPDAEVLTVVDVGLIAQVYANLFSNALKYTREVSLANGEKKKYISYGHEVIKDFFGPGKDGVKFNVFSTGPHIPENEREDIFKEKFRGSNVETQPGTGQGLAFIKNAVEIHGGIVGYEATEHGNNFYFILHK